MRPNRALSTDLCAKQVLKLALEVEMEYPSAAALMQNRIKRNVRCKDGPVLANGYSDGCLQNRSGGVALMPEAPHALFTSRSLSWLSFFSHHQPRLLISPSCYPPESDLWRPSLLHSSVPDRPPSRFSRHLSQCEARYVDCVGEDITVSSRLSYPTPHIIAVVP